MQTEAPIISLGDHTHDQTDNIQLDNKDCFPFVGRSFRVMVETDT
jgi:hypothetical protein